MLSFQRSFARAAWVRPVDKHEAMSGRGYMSGLERPAALVQDEMLLLAYLTTCSIAFLALLSSALLIATAWRSIGRRRPQVGVKASAWGPHSKQSDLDQALNQASALNAYTSGQSEASYVRWGDTLRYVPRDYEQAIQEIPALYKQGRALSLDVSHMDQQQAIRLIDFCSGVARMANGWILRVADHVVLLVPDC